MQFYLLMPIWLYIVKRFKPIATIVVALVVTVLMMSYFPNILSKVSAGKIIFEYNDRVFTTYLIYWIGGCYVAVYLEEFKAWITRHIKWIVLSTLLLLALFAAMNYIQLLGIKNFKSIEIIHMFYCLGAITSLYSACMHLKTKNNKVTAALYNINKCSFYIYLSHCLVLNIIQEVCVSKEISSIASQFMIKALVVYGVTIIGSNLYLWIKQRLYNSIYKASENKEQV
jgi:peptidoglycan/LPS O-acetylase OafA/YrhL